MMFLKQIQRRIQPRIAARFPLVRHYARILKWRVVGPIRRVLIQRKTRKSGLHVNPYQICWISPHLMKHTIYGPKDVPSPATVSGMIKGGDWDRRTLPVEDLDIVRGARDRFVNGMSWDKTEYYRSCLDLIKKGEQWRGCRNKQDLDRYCVRFDRLYQQIRNNGYRPQTELSEAEYGNTAPVEHEITVHIDRGGRFLFCDGRHRLAIVLLLGIDRIPVKVCIRHAKWEVFCKEILLHAKKNGDKTYQPLTHPDLQHVPSAHGEKRFLIIRDNIPQNKGQILDIGANWGYFCHRFEELGFDCCAVDADPQNVYFLEKLRLAQDRNFKIIPQSILTYKGKTHFAVVLALNIFHHFLKRQDDYNALVSFLKRIDMDTMIFESHHTSEPQMIGAYRNFEPEEFVQFILSQSSLTHCELIGKAEDERPIYKLWR